MTMTTSAPVLSDVFGSKPSNAIFFPQTPLAVRFNCQSGQLALDERNFLGSEAEISVIKVARFFGDLGKTKREEWLQLFYVPAPGCNVLPRNTVCVSYIKTRSLSGFNQQIVKLLGDGINPAEGVFHIAFNFHSSGEKNYYSLVFKFRSRREEEFDQLKKIAEFLQSKPSLIDLNGTRNMIALDGLDAETIAQLVEAGKSQPDSPLALPTAAAAPAPTAEPATVSAPAPATTPIANDAF